MGVQQKKWWGAVAGAVAIGLTLLGQPAAQAEPAADVAAQAQPSVIFLGDSVTAGFGYFGQKENAKNISGSVNQEFANSWYFGDNSLSDCNPVDGTPIDQCSNNNWNGTPWSAGPWQPGPNAPNVAYSYQIAGAQDPNAAAPIENWAMTGSTPEQWDKGGPFAFQLQSIKDTTVVLTLGANPILGSMLKIRVSGYPATDGACSGTEWLGWTGWWAYPPSHVVDCANQQWAQNQQTQHLLSIYQTLLSNNNKVLALRYHRACPWSFGNWQPNGNVAKGPAAGNSCTSQTEKVSECSSCKVDGSTSQWAQMVAAHNAMNDNIAAAVAQGQTWAKSKGIDPTRLQMATPDQAAWSNHQGWTNDSWVFKNDTWIHPSKAGHTQLARTVTQQTCQSWGQWCTVQAQAGSNDLGTVVWSENPSEPKATEGQTLKTGKIPGRLRNRVTYDLPNVTKEGHPVSWRTTTSKVCRVNVADEVGATRRDGTCKLKAYSVGGGSHRSLKKTVPINVR